MKALFGLLLVLGACATPGAQVSAPSSAVYAPALPTDPVCTRAPEGTLTVWAANDKSIVCASSACKPPFSKPSAHITSFQGAQSIARVVECWCCYEEAQAPLPVPPVPHTDKEK